MPKIGIALAVMVAALAVSACSTQRLNGYKDRDLPPVAKTRPCHWDPCEVVVNVDEKCVLTVDVDRTVVYDKKNIFWYLKGAKDFKFTDTSIDFKGKGGEDFEGCSAQGNRKYRCFDKNVNKVDFKYEIHVFTSDGTRCNTLDPYIYNQ